MTPNEASDEIEATRRSLMRSAKRFRVGYWVFQVLFAISILGALACLMLGLWSIIGFVVIGVFSWHQGKNCAAEYRAIGRLTKLPPL